MSYRTSVSNGGQGGGDDDGRIRHYAGVHRVDAGCTACDRWVTLDLDDLIRRGLGDMPLINLPLRCSECGKTGHKIVVSGRTYPFGRDIGDGSSSEP